MVVGNHFDFTLFASALPLPLFTTIKKSPVLNPVVQCSTRDDQGEGLVFPSECFDIGLSF